MTAKNLRCGAYTTPTTYLTGPRETPPAAATQRSGLVRPSGGTLFRVFALVALPTLFVLGVFTFVRLVELGIEDFLLGRAINRIRHYYLERAGDSARYFMLSGSDDAAGVVGNMGIAPSPR